MIATVTRRTKFRLMQVERRIHILEGRNIVLLNIDKVIKVIRESDEPKPELMKRFDLTDIQAEDILEIRLRQLASDELTKTRDRADDLANGVFTGFLACEGNGLTGHSLDLAHAETD